MLNGRNGQPYDDGDLETIRTFASHAAVALDNVLLHQEAQRLSVTDGLTGLRNYRRKGPGDTLLPLAALTGQILLHGNKLFDLLLRRRQRLPLDHAILAHRILLRRKVRQLPALPRPLAMVPADGTYWSGDRREGSA